MRCIVCLEKTRTKNIVKPVCRCTIKTPICKGCYLLTNKMNLECTVCMEQKAPCPPENNGNNGIMVFIINIYVDPLFQALMKSNSAFGLIAYIILSVFFTVFMFIPWIIVNMLTHAIRNARVI
jgi:hypothetical protein